MKREIKADKPTPIKSPKSPRAIENEMGDFLSFMVEQMAQRFRNQVLDQLNVSTVDKFADIEIEVSRTKRVVDRYETKTRHYYEDRSFTDADGVTWEREERVETVEEVPVYRTERFSTSIMASGIKQDDVIIGFEDAQTGNFAAILLKLSKKVKRKLLKQFDDSRIEAEMRKQLGKLDRKSRMEFYNRIAARSGLTSKTLLRARGFNRPLTRWCWKRPNGPRPCVMSR